MERVVGVTVDGHQGLRGASPKVGREGPSYSFLKLGLLWS